MPYIEKERRIDMEPILDLVVDDEIGPCTAGEFNYLITAICQEMVGTDSDYSQYNEVIGVLESVKLEFYRRMMADYEDKKIEQNGDVY